MKIVDFFLKKFNNTNEVLNKFRSEEDTLVTFEQLNTFPINKTVSIYPEKEKAILTTRISTNDENLSFRVEMKKGEYWKIHKHDCLETILLYKGKLQDKISKKVINRIYPLVIEPFTPHIIKALEDSIFYVEFKAP